jgi:hypothetical protein
VLIAAPVVISLEVQMDGMDDTINVEDFHNVEIQVGSILHHNCEELEDKVEDLQFMES